MLSAMNDEQGDDEMHRGNETLAAFMLHHCMHVSLNGYPKLNPFRCLPESWMSSREACTTWSIPTWSIQLENRF